MQKLWLVLVMSLLASVSFAQTPTNPPKVFSKFKIDSGQTLPDGQFKTAESLISSAIPNPLVPIIEYDGELYLITIKPIQGSVMVIPYRNGETFGGIKLFFRGLSPYTLVPLGSVDSWGEGSYARVVLLFQNAPPQFTSTRVVYPNTKSLSEEISGVSNLGTLPMISFREIPKSFWLYFNGELLNTNQDFIVYPSFNFAIVTPGTNPVLARVDDSSPKDVFTVCTAQAYCSSALADFPAFKLGQDPNKTQTLLNQLGPPQ